MKLTTRVLPGDAVAFVLLFATMVLLAASGVG